MWLRERMTGMLCRVGQIKLFCLHPVKMMMVENKLEVHKDKTLREAVEIARKVLSTSLSHRSPNQPSPLFTQVSKITSDCMPSLN